VVPLLLTFLDGLAREPEARRLLLRSARRSASLSPRDVVRDIILLRVLVRIREHGNRMDEPWTLSAENASGTITIRTQKGPPSVVRLRLDDQFEKVVWNHAAVAPSVPLFPQRLDWGWIAVGPDGRYEFKSLSDSRTDDAAARALLERTLGP
jgi:hypothetical protein